jgi:hypothetical protein
MDVDPSCGFGGGGGWVGPGTSSVVHHEGSQTSADTSRRSLRLDAPTTARHGCACPIEEIPGPQPEAWGQPELVVDNAAVEITENTADAMTIQVTRDEAITLNNALNEVCNGINWSDNEFSTRMGLPRVEAKELLRMINDALRSRGSDNN